MATYLLTWNPKVYKWDDFEKYLKEFKKRGYLDFGWSCGRTKKITEGDRVFLIKLGKGPRGIFASDTVMGSVWEGKHWNDKKKG